MLHFIFLPICVSLSSPKMRLKLLATVLLYASGMAFNTSDTVQLERQGVLCFNPTAEKMHASLRAAEHEIPNAKHFATVTSRTGPSGRPGQLTTGFLPICDELNGTSLVYVSNVFNSFGVYGPASFSGQRLEVSLDMSRMGPVSIATMNGPDYDLPLVVGITGFASDASGLSLGKYICFS
ncbi:hypothetical protein J3R30DRAFT_3486051 [Lentinula aciculospora]|uniref:Uncharacterized protein n=1 Tax=Lentinula aciculospora TaxID=153920 RepID=A0A9W9AA68_9AGAR|nr:hypothetical protein J3R30DRAFT_3486051 [Lentinula aciculospora]